MKIAFAVLFSFIFSLNLKASQIPLTSVASDVKLKPDPSYQTMRVLLFPLTYNEPKKYFRANEGSLRSCKKRQASFIFEAVGFGDQFYVTHPSTGKIISRGYRVEINFCTNQVITESATEPTKTVHDFSHDADTEIFIAASKLIKTRIQSPGIIHSMPYPGSFLVQFSRNQKRAVIDASVVNYVDIEDYVKGVIPIEMGEEFKDEARKTQAVASRTYGLRDMMFARCDSAYTDDRCTPKSYDVRPTTQDQVYAGTYRQTERSNRLVDETKGIVSVKYSRDKEKFLLINAEFSPKGRGSRMSQNNAGRLASRMSYTEILAIEYPGSKVMHMSDLFPGQATASVENGTQISLASSELSKIF